MKRKMCGLLVLTCMMMALTGCRMYMDYVVNNQIDWMQEAKRAAKRRIKIDTVTINPLPWYKQLSAMTNGISVPFSASHHTSDLIMASTMARGSHKQRIMFDKMASECSAPGMASIFECYRSERENE